MDLKSWKYKIPQWTKKYKYAVLVFLIGLGLLLIPTEKSTPDKVDEVEQQSTPALTLEESLTNILRMLDGAGEVKVLLTIASGEEFLYQTNDTNKSSQNSTDIKLETVTVTDSQRNETGLIRQINPPVYLGAIVLCQGADNPTVRLAITQAVSKITGLGADKISVLKMK